MLGIFEVSRGGSSGASADVRIIFAAALKANATGIVPRKYVKNQVII
ncbi:hypothetical protein LZG73_18035 [Dyadobacter sp. CY326]|nr:hypothetical protein [Dyadobacter sp. CY326]